MSTNSSWSGGSDASDGAGPGGQWGGAGQPGVPGVFGASEPAVPGPGLSDPTAPHSFDGAMPGAGGFVGGPHGQPGGAYPGGHQAGGYAGGYPGGYAGGYPGGAHPGGSAIGGPGLGSGGTGSAVAGPAYLGTRSAVTAAPPSRGPALVAHLGWEALLLVAAVILLIVIRSDLHGHAMWPLISRQWVVVLLPAIGFALSLRTRMVNLAVGGVASLAGFLVADHAGQDSFWGVALVVLLGAVVVGAVLGAVVGATRIPSWAFSLGLLGVAVAITYSRSTPAQRLNATVGSLQTIIDVVIVFAVLASVAGGALWLGDGVRGALSGPADAAPGTVVPPDPTGGRVVRGALSYAGSFGLAALGGIVALAWYGLWTPGVGTDVLQLALAAALLGGVAAQGGRGGIAGTVLGALLVAAIGFDIQLHTGAFWVRQLVLALAVFVGLGMGLVFRALARERPAT